MLTRDVETAARGTLLVLPLTRPRAHAVRMYTLPLNPSNLDSLGPGALLRPSAPAIAPPLPSAPAFDGTMAYAQHKRCQVEMTERWAKCAPSGICFYSMHPGQRHFFCCLEENIN
jgi:hypothetical protein